MSSRRSRRALAASAAWLALAAGLLTGAAAFPKARTRVDTAAIQPRSGANVPPGWFATYSSPANGSKRPPIQGHAPHAALALDEGESIHPAIPSEGFSARYQANLSVPAAGRYRFRVEVQGGTGEVNITGVGLSRPLSVFVEKAGDRIETADSAWAALPQGELQIRCQFDRTGDRTALFRVLWEKEGKGADGFIREPIPVGVVTVPAQQRAAATVAISAGRGRALMTLNGCLRCHDSAPITSAAAPLFQGPDLAAVTPYLGLAWMERFIADPQAVKPGCGMPDVVPEGRDEAPNAAALTHFLASLSPRAPYVAPATEPEVIQTGRDLYHAIGCVACHGPLDEPAKGWTPPAPLGDLKGKWRADGLSKFLREPAAFHPGGRMPSLLLTEAESDAIANYLSSHFGAAPDDSAMAIDPVRVQLGRAAFSAGGCANCHQVRDGAWPIASELKAKPLATLRGAQGCLSPSDSRSPRYGLSEQDRADLSAAVAHLKDWGTTPPAPAPIDATHLRIRTLACASCHGIDGDGGVPDAINPRFGSASEAELGDEGRLPPDLTGVGEKLQTQWLASVLESGARARPYMLTRMPVFNPALTADVPAGLARSVGVHPSQDAIEPIVNQELTDAGRTLAGSSGLNCISCHIVGDLPAAGTPGPDITAFAERLRYDWWSRYVMAPDRIKPGTRMTAFFATGSSPVTGVMGGDARRQADALWAYFTLGEFMPPPEGLPTQGGLTLRVKDRPMVLRAFLKSAGSRGIAIGYPQGVHFAFDAQSCRLVEAWKGDFLDASGAWAGRGGTVVSGQGPTAWMAPSGAAVTVEGAAGAPEFGGYRLDEAGVPTFLYSIPIGAGAVAVTDRFEPDPDQSLLFRRRVHLTGLPPGAAVRIGVGAVSEVRPSAPATVEGQGAATSVVGRADDKGECFIFFGARP